MYRLIYVVENYGISKFISSELEVETHLLFKSWLEI